MILLRSFYKKKLIIAALLLIVVYLSSLMVKVVVNQNSYQPISSDCILVLGHSIDQNNNPDYWLIKRLESALYLYKNGFADRIIVSGGRDYKDNISVALAMANWLIDKDIPEEHIYIEDQAKNTDENFKYAKEIANQQNIHSIIVTTNDFHIYRSMLIGSNYFENISGLASHVNMDYNKFLAYLKEPLSIIKWNIIK